MAILSLGQPGQMPRPKIPFAQVQLPRPHTFLTFALLVICNVLKTASSSLKYAISIKGSSGISDGNVPLHLRNRR